MLRQVPKNAMQANTDLSVLEPAFRQAIERKLIYDLGKTFEAATDNDWYHATALAIRDRIVDVWMASQQKTREQRKKRVYYLSIEFLIGRLLLDALTNLRMVEPARRALAGMGVDLERLRTGEPDAALGNGGLGRLAACFMDSLSALQIPAFGYGIRYENGLFEQRIVDGQQHEVPEDWLATGNPWEFIRPDTRVPVGFGGSVEDAGDAGPTGRALWYPDEVIFAVPYDTPIVGWRGRHANTLRLWSARASAPLHLDKFNRGDLVGATATRARAEAISRVLYPNDGTAVGQELRLRQEFFFTSATLQDLVRRHIDEIGSIDTLPDHAAVQLNDTHPAIAVAELMRILVDEHELEWNKAWGITRATLSYTNHTLLPEALESWPVELLGRLLPRHLQIIYTINWRHLREQDRRGLADPTFIKNVSLIHEDGERSVRMAHLAFIGTHAVNGVSALHTNLLRTNVFADLAHATNTRIVNKTNGIAFRRWLFESNPELTSLLTETLGERVLDDPMALREVERHIGERSFSMRYAHARMANKARLATLLRSKTGIRVDPQSLFDVHIKRIHEYKRQLLNLIETVALYQELRAGVDHVSRVKIFAGKAAASYDRAKLFIRLANDIGHVVNNDPAIDDRLKVVFVPNYSASLAEAIIPAADLSEQISTAGMEASGTGNMKLALNGALTIGTLDGANIEIRENVGADNVIIFGLTAEEVAQRQQDLYRGSDAIAASPRLAAAIDAIANGTFSDGDTDRYAPIVAALRDYDRFMVAADFDDYWKAQRSVDRLWRSPQDWWRMSILNTARMGWFSSDRTIGEYAADIWNVPVS
ncbi:MAG: glycogen/starch/alpha-glucan phosphorylase [Proteobacteria bacterium]|nr:glycogen/starch/alpha-glucan phosphorylase [Pseudomonadota bacterium]